MGVCPGEQVVELALRMAGDDAGDDVGEVGVRIDAVGRMPESRSWAASRRQPCYRFCGARRSRPKVGSGVLRTRKPSVRLYATMALAASIDPITSSPSARGSPPPPSWGRRHGRPTWQRRRSPARSRRHLERRSAYVAVAAALPLVQASALQSPPARRYPAE